ncbi:hypothetical protein EAM_1215 [Erwinia amylovora ATCC 49946]|nr:hypothetical protein EAM_1215 [Erwinia amylovora ATCC 49946]
MVDNCLQRLRRLMCITHPQAGLSPANIFFCRFFCTAGTQSCRETRFARLFSVMAHCTGCLPPGKRLAPSLISRWHCPGAKSLLSR